MSANWRRNGNWPNRLKDWEQRGPGPLPGEELWDRIEADLPGPRKWRILPVWWWLLFGGLLATTLLLWPRSAERSLAEGEPPPQERKSTPMDRASVNPAPGSLNRAQTESSIVTAAGTPDRKLAEATAAVGLAERDGQTISPDDATPAASKTHASGVQPPEITPVSTASRATSAPALRGPDDALKSDHFLSLTQAGQVPKVDPMTGRSASATDLLPPMPTESLAVSTPKMLRRVSPPGKFVPVAGSAPVSVQISAGISRMRTEVNTPPGVELSSVDRGQRFETGMGSFFALEVKKGRFGLSAGYREQPQSNEYFTRRQLNFDRNREEDSADGLRTSTYELEAKDGFSESTLEIEVKRAGNTQVAETDILRVEVRTDQELDVRTVPLLLTYEQPIGRLFALWVGAGFSHNELRLSQSRTLTRVQLGNGLILNSNRLLRGQSTTQQFNYWALQTQAGIFLAPRNFPLSLGVGVDFSRSLGNWWPQRPDRRWLETSGVNVTAGFRF